MLTEKHESKSLRISVAQEGGSEVMMSSATFSGHNIHITFDMLDREFCASHKTDVQNAIKTFIARLNAELESVDLPTITSE